MQRCHTRLQERSHQQCPDHYATLHVPSDCNEAVLRAAYKRRSLQLHPDRAASRNQGAGVESSAAAFQQLQVAYDVLRDPQKRAIYDFGESAGSWEAAARARYFPPTEFRPFARPARTPLPSEWDLAY